MHRSFTTHRRFLSSSFRNCDGVPKLEEENWEWYSHKTFYPARIGEVFREQYQIVGKLGYGAHSTAWLCRDLRYVLRSPCSDKRQRLLTQHAAGTSMLH